MKKYIKAIGIVAAVVTVTAAFGYTIDRPVWYRGEFVPLAEVVTELAAESVSSKLQRAEEQVERRARQQERTKTYGERVDPRDVEDLRFWKKRVRELKRKMRKLDK